MSAECTRCGSDIVYPVGTWPVGICPVCRLRDDLERARMVVDAARRYLRIPIPERRALLAREIERYDNRGEGAA